MKSSVPLSLCLRNRRHPLPCSSSSPSPPPSMGRDKTLALEKKEKKMRTRKGAFASSGPPSDWMQRDWLPSRVTEKEARYLVANGLVPGHGWRVLGNDELEHAPNRDERVLLISHINRGFFMSPHPFFYGFLSYFGHNFIIFLLMPWFTWLHLFHFVKISLVVLLTRASSNIFSPIALKT